MRALQPGSFLLCESGAGSKTWLVLWVEQNRDGASNKKGEKMKHEYDKRFGLLVQATVGVGIIFVLSAMVHGHTIITSILGTVILAFLLILSGVLIHRVKEDLSW